MMRKKDGMMMSESMVEMMMLLIIVIVMGEWKVLFLLIFRVDGSMLVDMVIDVMMIG